MDSKAQVSVEFIIFVGLGILLSISITLIAASEAKDFQLQREREIMRNFALKIQREILIASYVEDGYFRVLDLPSDMESINYSIIATNTTTIIKSKNSYNIIITPMINGTLSKGQNRLNKSGGVLYIN